MTQDELHDINLMAAQLREMSARMERKHPIETVRLALRETDPRDPDVLFDLPPRRIGGCGGAHG